MAKVSQLGLVDRVTRILNLERKDQATQPMKIRKMLIETIWLGTI